MISIYRGDEELIQVPINYGSKARKELMKEDSITLVFSSDELYKFVTGDYINDNNLGYYILIDDYFPVYNESTSGYDYTIKFDAYYYAWNNYLVKLNPSSSPELSFSYTRSIKDHANIILENIHLVGFKYQSSVFGVKISNDVVTDSKNIVYDNIHIIDAISQIAETFECEWWVEDNFLCFGKCQNAGNYDFEIGNTLSSMTPSDSHEEVGTRLYLFGSEKNLPADYRKDSNETYAIVQKRLMLPEGIPYLERNVTNNSQIKEFVKVFDVYPKVDSAISRVEYDILETENEDNTITKERRYYFTDNNFTFSEEYLLSEDLTIRFKTGSLAGMDFTLDFLKDGFLKLDINTQAFKIRPNENYGRLLPDENLFPVSGDEYYLLNWDSSKIAELGLVEKAEKELLKKGQEYLAELDEDGKTYTCTMRSHVAERLYMGNIKSLLNIGDVVTLINEIYFPNKPKKSRIVGHEYNLDIPYDNPVYIVGNKPKPSRIKNLEESVDKIIYSDEIEKNFGGSGVYVISRRDKAIPSDSNVFSSLRSQLDFLRKNQEDTAKEKITFDKGLYSKMVSFFETISSKRYTSGFGGEGFLLEMKDGLSKLEVDELSVRNVMTVFELLIQRIRAVGGQIVVSPADGKIKEVRDNGDSYFITFECENLFVKHDQIRHQTFTGGNLKSYWVEVQHSTTDGITVLKSEFNGIIPMPGDNVVLFGNTINTRRQNVILISATEEKPCIDVLEGVKSKSLSGCLKTRLGSLNDIVDATFGQLSGYGLYSENAYLKGEFIVKSRGESVDTMFAIQDGKIKSTVKQTQAEAIKGKTLLYNASFTDGLDGWITSNEADTLYDDGGLLFSHDSLLAQSVSIFSDPTFENVFFLNINGGWIKQHAYRFVDKPEFDNTKQYPLFFSCNVRCKSRGVLNVYMTGISSQYATTFKGVSQQSYEDSQWILVEVSDKHTYALQVSEEGYIGAGDEIAVKICNDGEPLLYNLTRGYEYPLLDWRDEQMGTGEEHLTEAISIIHLGYLEPTSDFVSVNIDGNLWNGTGDFYLSFSGEADFYDITIYTEKTEVRHQTLFEQTDKLVLFASEKLDNKGNILRGASVRVESDDTTSGTYINVYYEDDNKELQHKTLGEFSTTDGQTKIKLSGDNIILEGDISANGNIHVDAETGALTAKKVSLIAGGDGKNFTTMDEKGISFLGNDNKTYGYLKSGSTGWSQITEYPVLFLSGGHEGGYDENNKPIDNNISYLQASKDRVDLRKYQRLDEVDYEAEHKIEIRPDGIIIYRKDTNLKIEKRVFLHIADDGSFSTEY